MIKKKYYDFRQGGIVLAPIIGLSNFMMLAYLTIAEIMPFWLFVPIFSIIILVGFTLVGDKFRKVQFSTDLDLGFERAQSQGETLYQIMSAQYDTMVHSGVQPSHEFLDRMEVMRKIARKEV